LASVDALHDGDEKKDSLLDRPSESEPLWRAASASTMYRGNGASSGVPSLFIVLRIKM